MPKVIACYKWVIDEADIKVNQDLSLDVAHAKGKISDYDRNAIEAAVQAGKMLDGKTVALTFGTSKVKQSIKDALSRGIDESIWVNAEEAINADGAVTAKALAAAIKKIEDISLIVCAEGASDTYARQTAPRIGAILDMPVITSVSKIEIQGGTLIAVRRLQDCMETVKVELPAVVSVLPEIYNAPIPSLKAVLAASKKPVTEYKSGDLEIDFTPRTKEGQLKGYVMNRKNIIFDKGEASVKVAELVKCLKKEGVV